MASAPDSAAPELDDFPDPLSRANTATFRAAFDDNMAAVAAHTIGLGTIASWFKATADTSFTNTQEAVASADAATDIASDAADEVSDAGDQELVVEGYVESAEKSRDLAQKFAALLGAASGLALLAGQAGRYVRVNGAADDIDFFFFTRELASALTTGANQDVDFSAVDIQTIELTDPTTTITLSNPPTVGRARLILEGNVPGFDLTQMALAQELTSDPLGSSGHFGFRWKPDGTKFYTAAYNQDRIYGLSLSTPWDITTAEYTGEGAVASNPRGFDFNRDGTAVYFSRYLSSTSRALSKITLSTPWQLSLSDPTINGVSLSTRNEAIRVSDDETKIWTISRSVVDSNPFKEYTMSTPGDVSTATLTHQITPPSTVQNNRYDIAFNDDYSKCYIISLDQDQVHGFNVLTPGSIGGGLSSDGTSITFDGSVASVTGIDFGKNGTVLGVGTENTLLPVFKYTSASSLILPIEVEPSDFAVPGTGEKNIIDIMTLDGGASFNVVSESGIFS